MGAELYLDLIPYSITRCKAHKLSPGSLEPGLSLMRYAWYNKS